MCAGLFAITLSGVPAAEKKSEKKVPPVLNFKMKKLDGKPVELSKYQGKVVLIVNTASQCGATPQYAALQQLHEKFADQGLVVLGFPCNQFGQQEPGTATEISEFCTENYGVTFDMFSKIKVNGPEQAELYKYLTSETTNPKSAGKIRWNFEKFLIARDGSILNRFSTSVEPDSDEVVKAIQGALKQK